jgi:uncharacterized membrane protein
MTAPLIFLNVKAFMLIMFTTMQAEESDMEEKLKVLRDEVHDAKSELDRF